MSKKCSIVGCNEPIVIQQKGDEYLKCCEKHIKVMRQYYKNKYNKEK